MHPIRTFFKRNHKEFIFQIMVFWVLLLLYSYDQDGTLNIIPSKISFFTNYAVAAMVINYLLLPKLYSKKKFSLFFLAIVILVCIVILIDEYILEQIFFPDTRGTYFPGLLFTLIETLPIIVFFVGFKFAWDFIRKQSEIEGLKKLVRESELQFLKSQINPHFLFNNLNNLYVHAIEESPKTPSIILELSSALRYMLYDCKENFVPLPKETEHLKNYVALNELQIGYRGDIRFHLDTPPPNYNIAPLILMVFIENAFKHSTSSQSEDIVIHIHIHTSTNGYLTFGCRNSFLPEANKDLLAKGIGLANVKKRLALLYPDTHQLEIGNENGIFTVTLAMQLKSIDP